MRRNPPPVPIRNVEGKLPSGEFNPVPIRRTVPTMGRKHIIIGEPSGRQRVIFEDELRRKPKPRLAKKRRKPLPEELNAAIERRYREDRKRLYGKVKLV